MRRTLSALALAAVAGVTLAAGLETPLPREQIGLIAIGAEVGRT